MSGVVLDLTRDRGVRGCGALSAPPAHEPERNARGAEQDQESHCQSDGESDVGVVVLRVVGGCRRRVGCRFGDGDHRAVRVSLSGGRHRSSSSSFRDEIWRDGCGNPLQRDRAAAAAAAAATAVLR